MRKLDVHIDHADLPAEPGPIIARHYLRGDELGVERAARFAFKAKPARSPADTDSRG